MYTVEKHVERLKEMFKRDEPCKKCPAARDFMGDEVPGTFMYDETELDKISSVFCAFCKEFVGIDVETDEGCPCHLLGEEEAIARTKKALREWDSRTSKERG